MIMCFLYKQFCVVLWITPCCLMNDVTMMSCSILPGTGDSALRSIGCTQNKRCLATGQNIDEGGKICRRHRQLRSSAKIRRCILVTSVCLSVRLFSELMNSTVGSKTLTFWSVQACDGGEAALLFTLSVVCLSKCRVHIRLSL